MRIVLDTNTLVSGLLSPSGPPGQIVCMIGSGTLQLCYDARIMCEYEEVLPRPKFGFYAEKVKALLEQIEARGIVATGEPLAERLPDEQDEPFLEVAVGAKAACLVTGNSKHYPRDSCGSVHVVSPSQFLWNWQRTRNEGSTSSTGPGPSGR